MQWCLIQFSRHGCDKRRRKTIVLRVGISIILWRPVRLFDIQVAVRDGYLPALPRRYSHWFTEIATLRCAPPVQPKASPAVLASVRNGAAGT